MVGGVTLNGGQLMQEAQQDIEKLEIDIRTTYEEFPHMIMG